MTLAGSRSRSAGAGVGPPELPVWSTNSVPIGGRARRRSSGSGPARRSCSPGCGGRRPSPSMSVVALERGRPACRPAAARRHGRLARRAPPRRARGSRTRARSSPSGSVDRRGRRGRRRRAVVGGRRRGSSSSPRGQLATAHEHARRSRRPPRPRCGSPVPPASAHASRPSPAAAIGEPVAALLTLTLVVLPTRARGQSPTPAASGIRAGRARHAVRLPTALFGVDRATMRAEAVPRDSHHNENQMNDNHR